MLENIVDLLVDYIKVGILLNAGFWWKIASLIDVSADNSMLFEHQSHQWSHDQTLSEKFVH
jgi:hypothetical protein